MSEDSAGLLGEHVPEDEGLDPIAVLSDGEGYTIEVQRDGSYAVWFEGDVVPRVRTVS